MQRLICSVVIMFCLASATHAQQLAPAAQAPAESAQSKVAPGVIGAPPPSAPAAPTNSPETLAASSEYVLGPEDVIEVFVVGQTPGRARIYTDGTVQLDLVGRLPAAGRTPRQFAGELAKALQAGGFYAKPVVNVEVVSFASRYVTVLGAVGQPGLVPMNRAYHLSEILARVGGVREGAADYLVVRPESGPEKHYLIQKLASGDAAQDPVVSPGDKIFSPVAEVFYISGAVNTPGTYPLKTDMTISQAIGRGGGLNESGTDKHVKVARGGKVLKLDGNAKVEPNDVLTVSEKLF